jgi:hypothetical protein
VDAETHVAGVEANDSIGMSSAIVQEMGDGLGGGFCSLCLGRCECAKGNEQSGADGTSVVQECADDFLESGEACWRQRSGVVFQRR